MALLLFLTTFDSPFPLHHCAYILLRLFLFHISTIYLLILVVPSTSECAMWHQAAVTLGMVYLLWTNGAWLQVVSGLFSLNPKRTSRDCFGHGLPAWALWHQTEGLSSQACFALPCCVMLGRGQSCSSSLPIHTYFFLHSLFFSPHIFSEILWV